MSNELKQAIDTFTNDIALITDISGCIDIDNTLKMILKNVFEHFLGKIEKIFYGFHVSFYDK